MDMPLRVLLVEDSEDDALLVLRLLRRAGYDPAYARVQSADAMKVALERDDWDLVVSDYSMPQFDAPAALRLLNQFGRDVPFIVVSGTVGENIAVTMMKAGAHDYVLKQNLIRFVPAVQRELREAENRRQQRLTEHAKLALQVERDELLERFRLENEDLAALTQVTASATSTLDLDELLHVLLGRIADVMHADTATILLADGAELRVRASAGVVDARDSTRVARVGEGFAGTVAAQMQPVYVENAAVDTLIPDQRIRELGICSVLGVPLTRHGTLIGVLKVGWLTPRPRRDREVRLLEITAERCASAISNAQLYEEAKRVTSALRASEQRFRAIVAAEPECVKVVGPRGELVEMNAAGLAMLEADSLDDVRRRGLEQFILPEYRAAYRALHKRAIGGEDGLVEFEVMGLRGTRRWLETHAAPLPDAAGRVTMMLGITRDITERKLSSEKLRRSEQDLAITLQSIGDAVIATDTAGLITRMNATAERLTGWPQADAIGRRLPEVFRIIDAKTRAPVIDPVRVVIEQDRIVGLANHTALLARDGAEYQIADSAAPIRDVAGQIVGVVLVFNDVSEQYRVQQALASTVDLLERTGEMAKIGGWEVDLRTMKLYWSRETCRIHEFDSLVAPPLEDGLKLFAPEAQPIIRAAMRAAIDHGTPYDLELPKFTVKGRRIWVRTQATVVMEDGKAVKLVGALHDITARKYADAELRLQSAAMNATANSMIITDRNGTIEWVNPAFTTLTGYSAAEAIGRNQGELVNSGTHDQAFYQDLWKTILSGKVWHGETTNRHKDGSLYVVDQTITSVKGDSGEFAHFIAIARDLTEHKRLQAQFLHAQKMEVVGRLASGIAHDFNNLLTVINGTADLALMDLREDDPLRGDFLQIHGAGDRAAALTRQLLAFSRQQVMEPVVLNLSTLVADLRGLLQRLIGEEIALEVTTAEDLGNVLADPGQIEQVVMNLAVNARDAMSSVGTLWIETSNVEMNAEAAAGRLNVRPGPYVMLAIRDTGAGMDEATRSRIFEPFFTTKDVGKGTGLGLSTVYGIVNQSGGSIVVDSVLGQGTTFRIYLPRVDSVPHRAQPDLESPVAPASETVLIVEDEDEVRHLASRILSLAGYKVLSASNGPEALALIEQHEGAVHLLLTDVVMPLMTGRDLATHVAEINPRTKILYTSGYTDDAALHRALLDHAAQFVGKPYSASQLRSKVREVLDSEA